MESSYYGIDVLIMFNWENITNLFGSGFCIVKTCGDGYEFVLDF